MRTILALGVGFWMGRMVYINFDKKEAQEKENQVKRKLNSFLNENGLSQKEAERKAQEIIG